MELKLLDGKVISVNDNETGFDVAKKISESLAKASIAYKLNGKLYDLSSLIKEDGDFELITSKSEEANHILNHSAAHLMAEAISLLYKDAKFDIGPAIEDGFYYDIDFGTTILKEEDLAKIEAKMKELSKKNEKIIRKEISKEELLLYLRIISIKKKLLKI